MNMDDIELKLLAGMPVEIQDVGHIHIPTIKEIIDIGTTKYDQMLGFLCIDINQIEKELPEEIDNFALVYSNSYHNETFKQDFLEALSYIFKEQAHFGDFNEYQDAFFYIGQDHRRIDKDNFELIQKIIRIGNHLKKPEKEDYNPGNERAASFIEKLKQMKREAPKKKETMNLQSIVAGMAWKSNISILNIFDLTIYQLRNGFAVLENIDNYHHTLQGIYAGTVDSKKIKLDQIHWAKIIKD